MLEPQAAARSDFGDLRFAPQRDGHRPPGPMVWIAVLLSTCLLLYVLQKVLLLVVPLLLALILFYALFPVMARLVIAGLSREMAALTVIGGFCLFAALVIVLVLPRAMGSLSDDQAMVARYVAGGTALLQHTVASLEARSNLIAQIHLSQMLNEQIDSASGHVATQVQALLLGLIAWGPSLMLVPFLAYFFLRDSRHFKLFLSRAVPNAFFETTLYLMHGVDRAARAYFRGLLKLTLLDTLTLAIGLWLIGMPAPLALGLLCAILAWIPYVGSILGGLLVTLVAATDFADQPSVTFSTIALFILVRLLDDFVYMPLTVGKSLRIHPLITVLMIFIGGGIAGIAGLMLVLPLLGIILVIGETVGVMLTNPRLMARYRQGKALRRYEASLDLNIPTRLP